MVPCHSFYICGTWRSKEVGGLKLSYGRKGKRRTQEKLLWGAIKKLPMELTTELLYLELPTYFSFLWPKKIYVLHMIPPYQNISKVWIKFSSWIFFYWYYWFFINLQTINECAFTFLNTAVIIFCLMCSLSIPHSNQNSSVFPV